MDDTGAIVQIPLTQSEFKALQEILHQWISEGFATPPYTPEQYHLFELLGIEPDRVLQYDIRRPGGPNA